MGKFSNNLSERKTLYKEMIRLFEEKKDNVISIRKIYLRDQNFEGVTNVSRSVLSFIKKRTSRPKLSTVITFCVSLMLDVIEAYDLIELAGYKLSQDYEVDRAYAELLQYHNYGDIDACNKHLEILGIDRGYFLGIKSR